MTSSSFLRMLEIEFREPAFQAFLLEGGSQTRPYKTCLSFSRGTPSYTVFLSFSRFAY
jgi:hypothetical protein